MNFCTSERANDLTKFSKRANQLSVCTLQKEVIKFSKSVNEITGFGENYALVVVIDADNL